MHLVDLCCVSCELTWYMEWKKFVEHWHVLPLIQIHQYLHLMRHYNHSNKPNDSPLQRRTDRESCFLHLREHGGSNFPETQKCFCWCVVEICNEDNTSQLHWEDQEDPHFPSSWMYQHRYLLYINVHHATFSRFFRCAQNSLSVHENSRCCD